MTKSKSKKTKSTAPVKKSARLPAASGRPFPAGRGEPDPYSGLAVGDEVPSLTRGPIERVHIARYAGATGEFSVMNLDDTQAKNAGMPQVMVQPMLAGATCAQMLTDWLQGGRVLKLDLRFLKIVWPGDAIACHGRVADLSRADDRSQAEVDLWAENQKGELVIRGAAVCELKRGATLLRPPPAMVPRKAPPPPLVPRPAAPAPPAAAGAKSSKKPAAKKPAAKSKSKKASRPRSAVKTKRARPAAKHALKKKTKPTKKKGAKR